MTEPVRAILMDLEGAAVPMTFHDRNPDAPRQQAAGRLIFAQHASDPEVEDALEEAGRLMGGFSLKLEEARRSFCAAMKQGRKATPLKIIQA